MGKTLPFVLGLAFWAAPIQAQENWPRFRGPGGQGHSAESDVPLHWTSDEHVAWKTEIPGEGWSSPIVWGQRVFLTTATDGGIGCQVICLDAAQGRILWKTHVFDQVPERKEGKNSYATPTPCTDGLRVFAVFGDGSAVALDFDGSVVWMNREAKFYSRHGLGASPMLYDGLLIMPYDGSVRMTEGGKPVDPPPVERLGWQIPWDRSELVALDSRTGKRVWTAKRGMSRIAHASPIVIQENGKDRILSIAGDVVQAFDPKNGDRIWSAHSQGEGLVPSPVSGDGVIFASSGFEKPTVRAFRTGGIGEVTQSRIVWEQPTGAPTLCSLLYVKPHVYALAAGVMTCYAEESGAVVYRERIGGDSSASPVFSAGRIYALLESGETVILEPGPKFNIVARNPIGEKCQASIAVSGGRVFIRSAKHLYAIGN